MYVIASFQYSVDLELAIAEIENIGIQKHEILVLPLDKRTEGNRLFDSMHHSDGKSFVELAAVLGTIFMLLGSIYGFVLKWGPIIWALIGLIFGSMLGFFIDYFYSKYKHEKVLTTENLTEVFLMIHCKDFQVDQVKKILWEQQALGLGTYIQNVQM
ncbi:hypothetical protein ACOI1C_06005 [Bacillus sp. DJP31]|uniref:hypothetical protein n=1 Tax=Bacillus sp. DJP31 TaxID=3409789 RepID=UPI003BB75AAF